MSSSTMSSSLNFKGPLHSSFPPDKESSWPFPKDEDGMILSNNSIRGELSCLKQAVHAMERRGTYCEWEIAAIQRMWNSHFIHMEAVRHKEEDKFKPILNRRFRLPESKALDYGVILHHLKELRKLIAGLQTYDAARNIQAVREKLRHYDLDLRAHLSEKEVKVLPLIRAYFSASEWSKLLWETSKNDPSPLMGSFIHFQTEHRFRSVFMKQAGIPGFVWHPVFRGAYISFQKEFVQPYGSLLKGMAAV